MKLGQSYYLITTQDKKYVATGRGFYVDFSLFAKAKRPRMFTSKVQAEKLFRHPYIFNTVFVNRLSKSSINSPSLDNFHSNISPALLKKYFKIIEVRFIEVEDK